jgi:predicted alpha-1,2-mannosidase
MRNKTFITILVSVFALLSCNNETENVGGFLQPEGLTKFVNPFIGTEGGGTDATPTEAGGNSFAGACLPFGMVKLGPDCVDGHYNSGYTKNTKLEGFSHTHTHGVGGGAKYGNILVLPFSGKPDVVKYGSSRSNERAHPGYYAVDLTDHRITAELTTTSKTGFHRYTFHNGGQSGILIDAGHFLLFGQQYGEKPYGEGQVLVGSEVEVISDREIQGYSRVRGGWNIGGPYTVYFYVVADKPAYSFSTWKNEVVKDDKKVQVDSGDKTGAYFSYNLKKNETIQWKVGISYISCQKAKSNLQNENPGWDFELVHTKALETWNAQLEKIQIDAVSESQDTMFYTALYHTMLMPVDRTGENPKWKSSEPYYDDYYCLWDTYRATHPLTTLISESRQIDMIRSLIDIYRYEAYMPDARSGNENGRTQGGSNSDILIADAYVKGLKGIDYEIAYQSMVKNAEITPGDNERKEGRGGIDAYIRLGYVPFEQNVKFKGSGVYDFIPRQYERAGTRTVEYSLCDFALAEVAKGLGKDADYKKYQKRASNWQNLWRPITDHGSTGFIWPRRSDGTWVENYSALTGGAWDNFFYEGHSWEYSLFVPHDVKAIITKSGGAAGFINRLDTYFNNNYFNAANEPGFLTPVLYNYAGRPDKAAERVSKILHDQYSTSRSGVPGNDDSGAMSSWFVFHSMGFYPNAGQDVYLISSPLLSKSVIHMENGRDFTVVAKNLTDTNIYVHSAKLNGNNLEQSWFRHTDIKNGGTLELIMGDKPSDWGQTNLPPSMSDN